MILRYPDTVFEGGINPFCSQERRLQIVLEAMLLVFKTISVILSLECRRVVCRLHSFNVGCFQERS
jgi:hypothetical protein